MLNLNFKMMKKSLLSFVAIFVALIAFAQPEVQMQSGPQMSLDKEIHDYGTIVQNADGVCHFTVTNTGNEPLIISNAKGSCGCTVPKWPKEPVAPGESAEIQIVYKPGKQKNQQTKSITVTANTEPDNTILKIKANVIEDAAATE